MVLQITIGNELSFRMFAEPAFAVPQQLFDFGVADPLVLVIIEHRDKHIEMRQ